MRSPNFCPICRADVTNGLGPSGLPMFTKFLQLLPSSHLFSDAANWHDMLYHSGSTESDRKKADDIFLELMNRAIRKRCKWFVRPWYKLSAYRNYLFVRKFGWKFFNYQGCKRTNIDHLKKNKKVILGE